MFLNCHLKFIEKNRVANFLKYNSLFKIDKRRCYKSNVDKRQLVLRSEKTEHRFKKRENIFVCYVSTSVRLVSFITNFTSLLVNVGTTNISARSVKSGHW